MKQSGDSLVPRNGHTLEVIVVCRISGCQKQKELSNEDQEDNAKETVSDRYQGATNFRIIATKAKGEWLDRDEIEEIEAAYRFGKYDLFIYDDLSRLIRGGEAARLLGVGVDNRTRSICIQDGIDTVDPTREEDALNACSENVAHNERTSRSIKQKCMNRFRKLGGPTGRPIAGYLVPEGAKTYDDWRIDPTATPTIDEGADRLLVGNPPNFSAVAEWFNSIGFRVGPYARRKKWKGQMLARFYDNTLLKGLPRRGKRHTVKNHERGRRLSQTNPKGPTYYHAPHLAHLDPLKFDALAAWVQAANRRFKRASQNGCDPLLGRSRKRCRFPRPCACC